MKTIAVVLTLIVLVLSGCAKRRIVVDKHPLVVHEPNRVEVTIRREGFDTIKVPGEWLEGELYINGDRLEPSDMRYADAIIGIRWTR